MKVSISHPTGNANVRAATEGLAQAGLLETFYTSIACFPDTWLYKIAGFGPLNEIRKRSYPILLKGHTKTYPWDEAGRLLAKKFGKTSWISHEKGRFCIDQVYQKIDQYVASRRLSGEHAVYAYEDAALASFKQAKSLGVACLYDLPIGYWRIAQKLMSQEFEARPEWAPTLTGFMDSPKKLQRKDAELALADHIFVASSFTKKTLDAFPGTLAPVSVIPYGFPPVSKSRRYTSVSGRKLKLLFVGGLSQRKGIANVLDAVEGLESHIELTIVGRQADTAVCKPLEAGLRKYRWIPALHNNEVLTLMQQQDVLVFPSLFEGFGLVITEAMSQGTPVITTDRTAGPDLIMPNENGWLVEAGNSNSLRAQIEALLIKPSVIKENGLAALQTASQRPWMIYGTELSQKVKEILTRR